MDSSKMSVGNPVSPPQLSTASFMNNNNNNNISMMNNDNNNLGQQQTSSPLNSPNDSSAVNQTFNIRSLIAQKERELHDINDYRVNTLEEELRRREKSESKLRTKFAKLKEDFTYNLKLIEDRDAELDRYEANFESLKVVMRGKSKEINELKTQINDLQSIVTTERARSKSNETNFEQKMKEVTDSLEKTRWAKDDDARKNHEVVEAMKRDHAKALREKDDQIVKQRNDMNVSHDDIMRKREEEFRRKESDWEAKRIDLEKSLQTTKMDLNNAQNQLVNKCRDNDNLKVEVADMDRARKQALRELEEQKESTIEQVSNLEQEKQQLAQVKQSLLDEYEGKMGELLESLHSVERAFVQQREQFELQLAQVEKDREAEQERIKVRMEGRNEALMARIAAAEQETAKYQATLKETQVQNEKTIMGLKEETETLRKESTLKLKSQEEISNDLKNQLWNRDLQLKSKDEEATALQERIETIQSNEKKLKMQVEEVTRRELSQQRENSDLNLRWEQRWEEERSRESAKHGELTAVLQKQRDHLGREKKDLEERIVELEADLNRTRAELNAVRAHSRLSESLSNQYGKIVDRRQEMTGGNNNNNNNMMMMTNNPNNNNNSNNIQFNHSNINNNNLPPPESPIFSEDMGPPSPLKFEMQPSPERQQVTQRREVKMETGEFNDSINNRRVGWGEVATDLNKNNNDTSVQQERLRNAESAKEIMVVQENDRLRSVISEMRKEMESMKDLSKAKDEINYGVTHTNGDDLGSSTAPRQLVTERMQRRNFDVSTFGSGGARDVEDNANLRIKLDGATNDLKRLMDEREKLLEISNNLKAELKHAQSSTVSQTTVTQAVAEAEKQTSEKYEVKIQSIESKLAELAAHNKALTGELSKWSAGPNDIFSQYENEENDHATVDVSLPNESSLNQGAILDDKWSITESQAFDDDAFAGDEELIAEAVRSKMKLYRERNALDRASDDSRRLRTRSARERLARARESLELSGIRNTSKNGPNDIKVSGRKAPSMKSRRSGNISERATKSQQRVSQRLGQRQQTERLRRQKLAAERKKVRNYNIKEEKEDAKKKVAKKNDE